MGNVNIDLSKNSKYKYVAWACAAIGAGAGIATSGASTIGSIAMVGALSGLAGGILIPTVVAGVGVAAFMLGKGLLQFLKNEGPFIPLAAVMVGYASARALIADPIVGIAKKIGGLFKKGPKAEAKVIAPAAAAPSDNSDNSLSLISSLKLPNIFADKKPLAYSERIEPRFDFPAIETPAAEDKHFSPGLTD